MEMRNCPVGTLQLLTGVRTGLLQGAVVVEVRSIVLVIVLVLS